MFFITGPAPRAVLWARALVPLLLLFAYMVLRVYPQYDGRIPLAEVISAGLMIIGLVFVSIMAFVEIAVGEFENRATTPPPLAEITGRIDGVRDIGAEIERHRIAALMASSLTRHPDGTVTAHPLSPDVAPGPIVRDGALVETEPTLYTHEFTPARGLLLGTLPTPAQRPGRHRLKGC
jgi:hypothetical protein